MGYGRRSRYKTVRPISVPAWVFGCGVGLSFVLAIIFTTFAPALCELAAPVLCPGATKVETRSIKSISKRGRSSSLALSFCTTTSSGQSAREESMNPIAARGVLFGYGVLVAGFAAIGSWLGLKLRKN
jgi:hypothetical protein